MGMGIGVCLRIKEQTSVEWGIESEKFFWEPSRRALSMLHVTQLLDTLGSVRFIREQG